MLGCPHARLGRMMLSDDKLLARLREELNGMTTHVAADALVFQGKIAEASERQEVGWVYCPQRTCGPLVCKHARAFVTRSNGLSTRAFAAAAALHLPYRRTELSATFGADTSCPLCVGGSTPTGSTWC